MKKNVYLFVAVGLFAGGIHSLLGQGSTPTPTPPAYRGNLSAGPSNGRLPGRVYVTGTATVVVTITGSNGYGVDVSGTGTPVFTKKSDSTGGFNY